ncbi:hypothetical protein HW49_06215 [Porphyromonadaceae bacterium COT-184 OH4590]|nr:hypothetical protein HW49_06215 [Porphyromonadaceae bacterium COT-184 OH4590]
MTAKKRIGDNFLQKHEDLRIFNYIQTKKRAKKGQKQAKKPPKRETFLPKKSFFSGKATKTTPPMFRQRRKKGKPPDCSAWQSRKKKTIEKNSAKTHPEKYNKPIPLKAYQTR